MPCGAQGLQRPLLGGEVGKLIALGRAWAKPAPRPYDEADKAQQLRGLGLSEAECERVLKEARESAKAMAGQFEVEIWEGEHEEAFGVFQRCHLELVAGAGGAIYHGIRAVEIETAARALGVPFGFGLVDDVRLIASGACSAMNERAKP